MTVKEIVEKIGKYNITVEGENLKISSPNAWVTKNADLIRANKAGIMEYMDGDTVKVSVYHDNAEVHKSVKNWDLALGELLKRGYNASPETNKDSEMRGYGLLRYHELSDKAKNAAYRRFSWDFVNNKPQEEIEEEILGWLSKHWFGNDGGTHLGFI